jgi:signal transduction histidine kinase
VDGTLAWLRTNRLDAALAVTLTAAGLVQVLLWPIAATWVGVLYVVATTMPLAWRRTYPVEASVTSTVMWLVPTHGFPVFGFVVAILMFYALGCYGAPRPAVWVATAWSAVAGAVGTLLGPEPAVQAIGAVLVVVAPVLVGLVVSRLREQNHQLQRLAEDLRAERRRAEEAAIGAERARIAQELHDVVGHEVTLIAVQAEAASAALRVDPGRAVGPVEAIRVTAHRTLGEIRSVLDLLAPEDRTPTEGDLVALAGRAKAAGIPNTLVVTGEPWPAQSPASLAVSRIVRESLTNAGRHAPGEPVTLSVAWSPTEVRVTSTNAVGPRGASEGVRPGRGLTGIRHRAELLGGSYQASAGEGRFEVRVTLPAPPVAQPTAAPRGAALVAGEPQ